MNSERVRCRDCKLFGKIRLSDATGFCLFFMRKRAIPYWTHMASIRRIDGDGTHHCAVFQPKPTEQDDALPT